MIKNYFLIAWRQFRNNKLYTFINIAGLAMGISCTLLIAMYVADELRFDRYHTKADRIYRINEFFEADDGSSSERSSSLPFPAGPTLKSDFPNMVEASARFFNFQAPLLSVSYPEGDKAFNEKRFFMVDSTFHKIFDFPMLEGDASKALQNPNSVLITESMAEKYFGKDWQTRNHPIGQQLEFQGETNLMVTGILKDAPLNAHFQYDFLASISTLREFYKGQLPYGWYWNPCWTYIALAEGYTKDDLAKQLPAFVKKYFPEFIQEQVTLKLQPLTDIHLTSNLDFEIQPNGNKDSVYIFSFIAFFVLLIACMNFINLSTARSGQRALEVGVRKTLGGSRPQLMRQFLAESFFMAVMAVPIALVAVEVMLPWFNSFSQKAVDFDLLGFWPIVLIGIALVLLVGFGAGLYPAIVLSSYQPVKVLKGQRMKGEGTTFRKILVVLQFMISMGLITATVVATRQLHYLQTAENGFDEENILMVPVLRTSLAEKFNTFKDEALQHNAIKEITALEEILGAKHQGANYEFEGMTESRLFSRLNVHHDFVETFGIELAAGRSYSEGIETDERKALVVNETLVNNLGWEAEEAIGKRFHFGKSYGEIIGVVKDFNFTSKHNPVGPLALPLNLQPEAFNLFIKYMAVRIDTENAQQAITQLETLWKKMVPNRPFEYFFLDQNLKNLYEAENKLSRVAGIFGIIAILVASLGLLGLTTFTAEQRSKEIGIRKVLGSQISRIILLLTSDFLRLLGIAFMLACPLTYFGLHEWLSGFAYRIGLEVWHFALSGFIVLFIALGAMFLQVLKAALVNPVEVLRDE